MTLPASGQLPIAVTVGVLTTMPRIAPGVLLDAAAFASAALFKALGLNTADEALITVIALADTEAGWQAGGSFAEALDGRLVCLAPPNATPPSGLPAGTEIAALQAWEAGPAGEASARIHAVINRSDVAILAGPDAAIAAFEDAAAFARYCQNTHRMWARIAAPGGHQPGRFENASHLRLLVQETLRFNRSRLASEAYARRCEEHQASLLAGSQGLPAAAHTASWITPFFVRADLQALRYQRRYQAASTAIILLPLAALVIAASQALFGSPGVALTLFHLALVSLALGVMLWERRSALRDRWLAYRFLAERFRSAFFLALLHVATDERPAHRDMYPARPLDRWAQRVFASVQSLKPNEPEAAHEPLELWSRMVQAWLEGQERFYERASARLRRTNGWLVRFAQACLVCSGIATATTVLSLLTGWEPYLGFQRNVLVFVGQALPAAAAGITSLRMQREYERNAERYAHMGSYFHTLARSVDAAHDANGLRALVVEAESAAMQENSDWLASMRFREIRLSR